MIASIEKSDIFRPTRLSLYYSSSEYVPNDFNFQTTEGLLKI